ncbi:MAG: class I mannose-6-phosphate isomerase [Prevotellaceae bacterium]|jgi:mannose-6-phosphate isomerase|nr:class I mannose-6-phosphate isomerase [Prevotellaceae bacterium]
MDLYPLKFKPILHEKVWGGNKLQKLLNKQAPAAKKIGESWELSSVAGYQSEVSNGFLAGNTIEDLVEVYMDELVGEQIYQTFGVEFPLLVKFLYSNDILSLQVHPNDELAKERHHAYGKSEMWYILDAEPDAEIIIGFNRDTTPQEFTRRLNNKTLHEITNIEKVAPGEAYYLPAGAIHAMGKGVVAVEIQQTSDITYRIHDWGRKGRDLHLDLAADAISYKALTSYKRNAGVVPNVPRSLFTTPYFTVNQLSITRAVQRSYDHDSFVVYSCTKGSAIIKYANGTQSETLNMGETMLIPATLRELTIEPQGNLTLLEAYIEL